MAVGYVVDADARPTGVGIAGLDGRPIEAESESAESQAERGRRAAERAAGQLLIRPNPFGVALGLWIARVGGHLMPADGWRDLAVVDLADREARLAAARATVDDRIVRVGVRCQLTADERSWYGKVTWWWPGRHAPAVERTVGMKHSPDPNRAIILAWQDARRKAERRIVALRDHAREMVRDERGQATWVMTAGMMGVLGAAALAAVLLLHP